MEFLKNIRDTPAVLLYKHLGIERGLLDGNWFARSVTNNSCNLCDLNRDGAPCILQFMTFLQVQDFSDEFSSTGVGTDTVGPPFLVLPIFKDLPAESCRRTSETWIN